MAFLNDFENKKTHDGVHYSRYIASWLKSGGMLTRKYNGEFKKWLESLELYPEEVKDIVDMTENGKMELEDSAWEFIKNEEREREKRIDEVIEGMHRERVALEGLLKEMGA